MQTFYDPNNWPHPDWWDRMGMSERIQAVAKYHQAQKDLNGSNAAINEHLHAIAHVIVENLLMSGRRSMLRPVLEKLMRQGLTRHQAIHAIASVLFDHVTEELRDRKHCDRMAGYLAKLNQLDAIAWARRGEVLKDPHLAQPATK